MRSPLTSLHNALYTALDGIVGLTAYSFVPQTATYPYVYIERKQSRPDVIVKNKVEHRIRVKLIVATNDKDISTVEGIIDDIEGTLDTVLTLADDWSVVRYSLAPDVDIYPARNFDGTQGHAADIFYDFSILDTQ